MILFIILGYLACAFAMFFVLVGTRKDIIDVIGAILLGLLWPEMLVIRLFAIIMGRTASVEKK